MTTRRAVIALGLVLCVGLSACGGERIRDIYYALDVEVSAEPSARPIPGTVRVTPLTARGFVAGTRIVYRTAEEPLRVQRYNEYLWADVPAGAVANALLAALRSGRVFENAVGSGDPARASYLLSGELSRFEHRPTDPMPHVTVALTLVLVDAENRRLMVSKTYTETEPTPRDANGLMRPEDMVAAFNRATGRIIDAALRDIRDLARRTGRG
jgi:cholesterol transport system auxiliary component